MKVLIFIIILLRTFPYRNIDPLSIFISFYKINIKIIKNKMLERKNVFLNKLHSNRLKERGSIQITYEKAMP